MARGVESFSASFDSFLVRYVSVKRKNVKCYQEGIQVVALLGHLIS